MNQLRLKGEALPDLAYLKKSATPRKLVEDVDFHRFTPAASRAYWAENDRAAKSFPLPSTYPVYVATPKEELADPVPIVSPIILHAQPKLPKPATPPALLQLPEQPHALQETVQTAARTLPQERTVVLTEAETTALISSDLVQLAMDQAMVNPLVNPLGQPEYETIQEIENIMVEETKNQGVLLRQLLEAMQTKNKSMSPSRKRLLVFRCR
jgi:hypothetical protein